MKPVKFHTIEQPDCDITTFVLSCNRLEVLSKTLDSYRKYADQQTRFVIVDDSGVDGVFEKLVEKYGQFSDVICFPENRSQWWAMDFMVSYCSTPYIFYLEDDWEFIRGDFLSKSKYLLEKYRDIGTIDLSFRTFEFQGIDSYDRTPQYLPEYDLTFYNKKFWRITPSHVAWYGWVGSPNLRRRDDLIMLGRVEKWHNEWNIDRRFRALGFRAVFLEGKFVEHLGDHCSAMEGKRPNDGTVPEDYLPRELLTNRVFPIYNYRELDAHIRVQSEINRLKPEQVAIVTAMVDINREEVDSRNFEKHYIDGLMHLITTEHKLVVYTDPKYFELIKQHRKDLPLELISYTIEDVRSTWFYDKVKSIVSDSNWINQSEWMKNSIIRSPDYISLTLNKLALLHNCAKECSHLYWVDSGLFKSYRMQGSLVDYDINLLNTNDIFMMKFPYTNYNEIHGYAAEGYKKLLNVLPEYVCRACFFGGPRDKLYSLWREYGNYLERSLENSYIGTEESIFTMIAVAQPQIVNPFLIENGDVSRCLNYMRAK